MQQSITNVLHTHSRQAIDSCLNHQSMHAGYTVTATMIWMLYVSMNVKTYSPALAYVYVRSHITCNTPVSSAVYRFQATDDSMEAWGSVRWTINCFSTILFLMCQGSDSIATIIQYLAVCSVWENANEKKVVWKYMDGWMDEWMDGWMDACIWNGASNSSISTYCAENQCSISGCL